MSEHDASIRQVWCWARLNAEVCHYASAERLNDQNHRPDRPYFHIDVAMHGCGYRPATRDRHLWNVIKDWMYDDPQGFRSRRDDDPMRRCEAEDCDE